tara:strand:- start:1457 stop:1930 length:474 start_codon:yes stop_codon:yes gene_type:complete
MNDEQEPIKAKVVLEIMGNPKEHVESTMEMVLKKVDEFKEVAVLKKNVNPPMEVEPKPFWSSFSELDLEFKDKNTLIGFCFDFMPSSIEIVSPDKFKLERKVYEDFLNDLLGRLHQYDMMLKNVHAQNIILRKELEKVNVDKAQPKPSDVVVDKEEK